MPEQLNVEERLAEIRRRLKVGFTTLDDAEFLAARLSEVEKALKRKAILDDYDITIENVGFDEWFRIVLSDEALEAWFGHPMEGYIQQELDAISLVHSLPPMSSVNIPQEVKE